MLTKIAQVILNYLGILNFQYDAQSQSFVKDNIALSISLIVFFAFQANVAILYEEKYFGPNYGKLAFMDIVSIANLVNWASINIFLYAERMLRRQKYLKLMNLLLKFDNRSGKFKETNDCWFRKCLQLFVSTVLFKILYVLIKSGDYWEYTFLEITRELLYSYAFVYPAIFTVCLEICFCYKVALNLHCLQLKMKKRFLSKKDFVRLFGDFNKLEDISAKLGEVFVQPKVFHIGFLYIAFPLSFFFAYSEENVTVQQLLPLFYWILVLVVLLSCSSISSFVLDKVSFSGNN